MAPAVPPSAGCHETGSCGPGWESPERRWRPTAWSRSERLPGPRRASSQAWRRAPAEARPQEASARGLRPERPEPVRRPGSAWPQARRSRCALARAGAEARFTGVASRVAGIWRKARRPVWIAWPTVGRPAPAGVAGLQGAASTTSGPAGAGGSSAMETDAAGTLPRRCANAATPTTAPARAARRDQPSDTPHVQPPSCRQHHSNEVSADADPTLRFFRKGVWPWVASSSSSSSISCCSRCCRSRRRSGASPRWRGRARRGGSTRACRPGLRAALAGYQEKVDAAQATAQTLARNRAFQVDLQSQDFHALVADAARGAECLCRRRRRTTSTSAVLPALRRSARSPSSRGRVRGHGHRVVSRSTRRSSSAVRARSGLGAADALVLVRGSTHRRVVVPRSTARCRSAPGARRR